MSDSHVSDFNSVVLVVECVWLQDVLKKAYNLKRILEVSDYLPSRRHYPQKSPTLGRNQV